MDRAVLITTTDKKDKNLISTRKIEIFTYLQISKLLDKKYHKDLEFIRTYPTSIKTKNYEKNRNKILKLVKETYSKKNKKLKVIEINQTLRLDIYSYFDGLLEIYKELKIPFVSKSVGGPRSQKPDKEMQEIWKNEFKKYILEILENENRFPSGIEIGRHFGLSHIWNIVKVSELYHELNLPDYLQRNSRKLFSP